MNRKYFAAAAAILAVAFAVLWIAYGAGSAARQTFALADSRTPRKTVYLTFDDGPSDRVTPKILDILDRENVKATFFIIGCQAETRDYLVKRESDSGHTVAVHSYSHRYNDIYRSPKALIADIERCNDVIERITGKRAKVYRFPGGSHGLDERLKSAVTAHGMKYVDWNASMCDAEQPAADADDLFKNAVETSAGRNDIVLLSHDSTNKTSTPEATKRIIKYYKSNGYTFGTL